MRKYVFIMVIAVLIISCSCISCKKNTNAGNETATEVTISDTERPDGSSVEEDTELEVPQEMDTSDVFEIELDENQGTGGL